ncbi:MAG: thioredoxin family protein [Candidatus Micrarchaeota archaeon]
MVLTPSSADALGNGDKAPDFILPGVDGKDYSISAFSGKKAVLVVFMCNHCPYVIPKLGYLVHLQEKYGPQGLQLIGINSNDPTDYPDDSFENMKVIAEQHKFNFPYLFDESQEVAKSYGATCTPDPFLFDRDLKLAFHGRFDDAHGKFHEDGRTSEMEDAIRQALAGREVEVPQEPSLGCSIKWKIRE